MRVEFTPSPGLYPFQSRWAEIDGARVHYVDEGSGPPILMCHGNPTWSFLYRNVILGLRDRFRCVAVDYPGFGLSDRPEGYGYTAAEHAGVVGQLVDQLELEGFIVIGQDWGGPIGMSVATERAERVSGLAFMNTWYWTIDSLGPKIFSRVMSSGPMQRRILERNFFVERLVPAGTTRNLSDEEMEHYRAVQPSPEARQGVAVFPRQILDAGPMAGATGGKRTAEACGQADRARLGDEGPRLRIEAVHRPLAIGLPRRRADRPPQGQSLHPGGRTAGDRRGGRQARVARGDR